MGMSTQHRLDVIRKPRVQITYDVEIGNAIEMKELPFVLGIIADLSGHVNGERIPLKQRKFTEIDRDNFGSIMSSIKPYLSMTVLDKISNDGRKMKVSLSFNALEDFEPLSIVRQVDSLNALYHSRSLLKDLLTKLDGNEALEEMLRQIMNDPSQLNQLKDELGLSSSVSEEQPAIEEGDNHE